MKLYSWNVNGIRAVHKKGHLLSFLDAHQPDILCLQETKAERGQIELGLPHYREYWHSAVKKGYSGTAIFSKHEPLRVINGFPRGFARRYKFADAQKRDSADEGRLITAEFDDFYVVTVYTPNAKDDLSRLRLRHKHWDPAFLDHCRRLEREKPVIFCGDLNVAHTELDLANPKPNRGKKGFTDRGAQRLSELHRRRIRRYLPLVQTGQRPLLLVEQFFQRPGAQRRVADRLLSGVGGAARQGGRRRHSSGGDGERSLSGQPAARLMQGPA